MLPRFQALPVCSYRELAESALAMALLAIALTETGWCVALVLDSHVPRLIEGLIEASIAGRPLGRYDPTPIAAFDALRSVIVDDYTSTPLFWPLRTILAALVGAMVGVLSYSILRHFRATRERRQSLE